MFRKKLVFSLFATFVFSTFSAIQAADHLDAPNLGSATTGSVAGMGASDINDLYAFQSPNNPDNTVLIMTVNPFAAVGAEFDPAVSYEFQIDNTGDAVPDVTIATTFSAGQAFTTTLNGAPYAAGAANSGLSITGPNGVTAAAGRYDDPFFFDLGGFLDGLNFTGTDAFAGADVSAIVLEIPSADLGATNVGIQATTNVGGMQIDRMGRPAINTVLIPSARKQEFNEADPANDPAAFGADVEAAITGLSDAANAAALTSILLPDVLTYDSSDAGGFLNGRQLADDVIDAELTLLTGSSTPIGDGVDANDTPFSGAFPYLAPANIPEPTGIALAALGLSLLGVTRRRS